MIGGSLRTRRIIPKNSIMAVHAKSQLRSEARWSDAKPELLPRVGGLNRHFMAEREEATFRERLSRKIAVVISCKGNCVKITIIFRGGRLTPRMDKL